MKLRDQKVKYRGLPDRDEMVKLYESYTLQEIADLYGTTKTRVRRWFDKLGIKKRPQGAGNNSKYINTVTKEKLLNLLESEKTLAGISRKLGCSQSSVYRLLGKYNIVIPKKETTRYKKYCSKVRVLTEKAYNEHREIINPDNHPRTLCGVEGGYQIDHKLSVRFCYDNGISAEECASLENLQMLTWQENLNKRTKNIYEEQYVANRGTPGKLDT